MKHTIINRTLTTGKGWKRFELMEDVTVVLSNGDDLVIPKGFKHDKSSVYKAYLPITIFILLINVVSLLLVKERFIYVEGAITILLLSSLCLILNKDKWKNELPALAHDYLYVSKKYSRKFSDKQFKYLYSKYVKDKNILNSFFSVHLMYFFLVLFGGFVWNKNDK